MLPFSINTLMCKSDLHYLPGFLQSVPLGCEINIMFTEGGSNMNPSPRPIESLHYTVNGKEKTIMTRQKDKVGGEIKLYNYTYFDVNGTNKFSFSEAKNALIEEATREWIFNIDVDERIMIEPDEMSFIDKLPKNVGGVKVNIVNYTAPQKRGGGDVVTTQAFRIFRNDKRLRYKYRVHEDISWALFNNKYEAVQSSIIFKHRGYEGNQPNILRDKIYRNLGFMCSDLQAKPDDKYLLTYMKKSIDTLTMMGEIA